MPRELHVAERALDVDEEPVLAQRVPAAIARIELAREGASSLSLRGARILAEPLDLDSERVARLREHVPEAVFSSREGSLTLRIPGAAEPDTDRIAELERLTDAVAKSRPASSRSE